MALIESKGKIKGEAVWRFVSLLCSHGYSPYNLSNDENRAGWWSSRLFDWPRL